MKSLKKHKTFVLISGFFVLVLGATGASWAMNEQKTGKKTIEKTSSGHGLDARARDLSGKKKPGHFVFR
jgi:hypothetical protein